MHMHLASNCKHLDMHDTDITMTLCRLHYSYVLGFEKKIDKWCSSDLATDPVAMQWHISELQQ